MDLTRKAGLGLALLTVAGLAATAPVQAQTLYNTGVDASHTVVTDNTSSDTHYKITYLGTAGTASPTAVISLIRVSSGGYPLPPSGPYLPDSSTSAWIGPNGGVLPNHPKDFNAPYGYYDYQTTFTLPSSSYVVTGQWATDNIGKDIKINGVSISPSSSPGYAAYTGFTISSGLQNGVNTLDFIVYNANDATDNPTALRVNGLTATPVAPEPSSFAVFGFLGLGMAGLMLKARKRSAASATA